MAKSQEMKFDIISYNRFWVEKQNSIFNTSFICALQIISPNLKFISTDILLKTLK